jgi:hypothetical protein
MVGEGSPRPDGTGSTSDGPGALGAPVCGAGVEDGVQSATVASSPRREGQDRAHRSERSRPMHTRRPAGTG